MTKPIYVLGTGLSHNGSSCLLKDGKICAAIEKERITRIKQDGNNDTASINYCLEKEGIQLEDISLIVQNSPLGFQENGNQYYSGERLIRTDSQIPIITISHHLAHAYSAIGSSNMKQCSVLIIDGWGNAFKDCMDFSESHLPLKGLPRLDAMKLNPNLYRENNSYYFFNDNKFSTIFKDFSPLTIMKSDHNYLPQNQNFSLATDNSIGDVYGTVASYCFNDWNDAGKLMGLAPYGDPNAIRDEIFILKDDVVVVDHSSLKRLNKPSRSYEDFKKGFQYYANIANWVQRETERAVFYIMNSRHSMYPTDNLAYAGGVALNAVINGKILEKTPYKNVFIQPAAGDNGIALGCAFYGWLEILKKDSVPQSTTTCYGKVYDTHGIKEKWIQLQNSANPVNIKSVIDSFFEKIEGKSKIPDKDELLIQFNVKNAGVYQVKIGKDGLKGVNNLIGKPTSEVSIENTDFYQWLINPSGFNILSESKKIISTSQREFDIFMKMIDLDKIVQRIKFNMNQPSYSDLVHLEGPEYIREAARLLANGKIIGWFQDESEFGPRALGRRSILADPRNPGVRDYINSKIKFREDFRPFAPAVLLEDVSKYFETSIESPYMISISQVRKEWSEKLKGVVHVDGTCRIQTVAKDWNLKFVQLLKEFKSITGFSVLLNTSFNTKGMPIVEKADDALTMFYDSNLDFLTIQDLILKK